jgi:hypothetical protein
MRLPALGWVGVVAAAACAWGGCPRKDLVDLSGRTRTFKPDDYDKIRERWTRNRLVIRTFDSVINATVTYLSPEFVSAYVARYAQDYRMTRAERRRLLAARLAEVRAHHEFYLAATTADRAWNDFHQNRSIWRITLEDDRGTRVKPLSIKRLKINEIHRHYFPYTSVFHRAYLLKFPRTAGGKPFISSASKHFTLMIASPMGSARLVWFVKRGTGGGGVARPAERPAARPAERPAARERPRATPP